MRLFTLFLCCLCGTMLHAQTNHAVGVTSNVFTPDNLTIQVGDTVTWTNTQGFHNVNGTTDTYANNPEGFTNGAAASAPWTFQYVFTLPGTYDYQCDPHVNLGMTGKIVVESPPAADSLLITEIMYNPPESGSDSLEFIEIYNPTATDVDMEDMSMSGVTFTFPVYTLKADSFVIVAVNEAAFRDVFNYTGDVFQQEGGGLSNGGEVVGINDSTGMAIVEFRYDDGGGWPTQEDGTDGNGASIVLCDITADPSDGSNWAVAFNGPGVTINGSAVLGDPGVLTDCSSAPATLTWLDGSTTADEEDGTLSFRVVANNYAGGDFSVSLGGGSTVNDGDYTATPSLPATFTVGADMDRDTFTVMIDITDDTDEEGDETLELALSSSGAAVSGDATITLTIRDNDSDTNVTAIDDINDVDAMGVAISDGMMVTLQGTVHCIDFRGSGGYQFWIVEDGGDGINVFEFNDVDDYVVAEGDELQITGEIDQFRGMLEILPSKIEVISTGNDLVTPELIDSVGEYVEGKYVTLDIVGITAEDGIVEAGGGFNVAAILAGSPDTVTLRVENETGVDEAFLTDYFAGGTAFRVTGLVSQRDFEAPFDDFYQLYPCSAASFQYPTSTREPAWATEVTIYPNPAAGELNLRLPLAVESYRLVDVHGRAVRSAITARSAVRIDLQELPRGMYYLQLIDGTNVVTRPVIKQ